MVEGKYLSPMAYAAKLVDSLDDEIENSTAPVLSAEIQEAFRNSQQSLAYLVDTKFAVQRKLTAQINEITENKKWIDAFLKLKKRQLEAFKAQLSADIWSAPDVTFKGAFGKLSRIESDSVQMIIGDDITKDMRDMMGIDEKYIGRYHISKTAVGADLKAGVELPWASIKHKQGIRFPNMPKVKELADDDTTIDIA